MPVTAPEAKAAADSLPKEPERASASTVAIMDPEETAPTSKTIVPVPEWHEQGIVPSANRAVLLQEMALTTRAPKYVRDVFPNRIFIGASIELTICCLSLSSLFQ